MTNPAHHGLDPDQVQALLAGADQRASEPPRFDSREDLVDRVLGLARDAAAGQERPLTYLAGTVTVRSEAGTALRATVVEQQADGVWGQGFPRSTGPLGKAPRATPAAVSGSTGWDYGRG